MNIEQIKAAVDAARERLNIENRGELLPCPFCHGSAQLVESKGLKKAECARYEYDEKCFINPETAFATEDEDGVDGCVHIWNYRPAQEQADAALIALWGVIQIDESVFETAKTIISEPAYHSAGAALLAHVIMRMKETTDATEI